MAEAGPDLERYLKMIEELTKWPREEALRRVDELREKHSVAMAGKKKYWVTRGGSAKMLFEDLGGVEPAEAAAKVLGLLDIASGYTGIAYARVLAVGERREVTFPSDQSAHAVVDVTVGDAGASMPIGMFDDEVDVAAGLNVGDVVRLSAARVSKGRLHASSVTKVDEGEAQGLPPAGDLPMLTRRFLVDLLVREGESGEARATVVEVRGAYSYAGCPACRAKIPGPGVCERCGTPVEEPELRVRVPVTLDDGSLRVRSVLWQDDIARCAGVEVASMLAGAREDARALGDELRGRLVGREVVVRGRITRRNDEFELGVRYAEPAADPARELKLLSLRSLAEPQRAMVLPEG